jgi:hypothetical protein
LDRLVGRVGLDRLDRLVGWVGLDRPVDQVGLDRVDNQMRLIIEEKNSGGTSFGIRKNTHTFAELERAGIGMPFFSVGSEDVFEQTHCLPSFFI